MTRVGRIGTVNPCDHAAAQIRGLFVLITGRLSNERRIFCVPRTASVARRRAGGWPRVFEGG